MDAPIHTTVKKDKFMLLFKNRGIEIPHRLLPSSLNNQGNYLISLSQVATWLGEHAEEIGVDVLPGFAGDKVFYNDDGSVGGVYTGDFGIGKDGEQKDTYMPGMLIKAKQTIFSEGCRGSLTQKIIKNFDLGKDRLNPQIYGLGLKEVWEVDNDLH